MGRDLSNKPRKGINLPPELIRSAKRAALDAEEQGKPFPKNFSLLVEEALRQYLERNSPESLLPPAPGRPRKHPRKL